MRVSFVIFGLLGSPCIVAGAEPLAFPCDAPASMILPPAWLSLETSGAAWHTGLDALFVVDDEGAIAWMQRDGTPVGSCTGLHTMDNPSLTLNLDLEAVCVADPNGPYIFVLVEEGVFEETVLEVDYQNCLIHRAFSLGSQGGGICTGCPFAAGSLEALAFVPDAANPEGGLFYAATPAESIIRTFQLPIASSKTSESTTFAGNITTGLRYMRDLQFDAQRSILWAAYQDNSCPECPVLRALDRHAVTLATWDLPGQKQEGVAVAGCDLFVAEDHSSVGQVFRYLFMPTPGDVDCDGGVGPSDLKAFAACAAGPNAPPLSAPPITEEMCVCAFDREPDGDLDLGDLARFMNTPAVP